MWGQDKMSSYANDCTELGHKRVSLSLILGYLACIYIVCVRTFMTVVLLRGN